MSAEKSDESIIMLHQTTEQYRLSQIRQLLENLAFKRRFFVTACAESYAT